MKKKSIFLVGAMILMMGGQHLTGRHALLASSSNVETEVQISGEECLHSNLLYINAGLTHNIECEYCHESMGSEAHVDEDGDMCCDVCNITYSTVAPTTGEGYVSSTLTLSESVKISIKTNVEETDGVVISSWYENEMEERLSVETDENGQKIYADSLYSVKAIYNAETGMYEAEINFADVNGGDGIYHFDAVIYGKSSSMRYVRLSSVEYVENGISTVSTKRMDDGDIEVSIEAVDGGEIYIATNGEEPTEDSTWVAYDAGETYTVEDENNVVEEISVYYRSASTMALAAAPVVLAVDVTADATAMVTEWTIPSANTIITLPVSGTGLNLTVNWGDNTTETVTKEFPTHTYAESGTYNIIITGECPIFGYTDSKDVAETSDYYTFTKYLTGVIQWGELNATRYGFSKCTSLEYVLGSATENTFSKVTSMENMFFGCYNMTSVDVSNFKTDNVKNMSHMFFNCSLVEYLDVDSFNTTNVTSMENMFSTCNVLNDLDVSNFKTSNVTNFSGMFASCNKLESIDVTNFDISKADDISRMFSSCSSLEFLRLGEFYPKVQCNAWGMFFNCTNLKSLDLTDFNMTNITNTADLFDRSKNLKSIVVNNTFAALGDNVFSNTDNLEAIIITDEVPTANQFTSVKNSIPNVIFYVPTVEAETAYQTLWVEDYTVDRIEPILKLNDATEITIGTYDEYEIEEYLVAGMPISESGDYTVYGYNVTLDNTLDITTVGTYEVKYYLKRTVDGTTEDIMDVTKVINVEKYPITAPANFTASRWTSDSVIVLSWQNNLDPNAKYELSVKNNDGSWSIIDVDAQTPYVHNGLSIGVVNEYRIRAYNSEEYSGYTYTQGATNPQIASGDAILDTVKPRINYLQHTPTNTYLKEGDKFELLIEVTDANYYDKYNNISGDTISMKVGNTEIDPQYIRVEKSDITGGEQCRIIVDEMPYVQDRFELVVSIPANTIYDKALNGNNQIIFDYLDLMVVNSNITTDAPDVDLEWNTMTITCNQVTDVEPDNVIIYYQYKKSGDDVFTKTTDNVITGLDDDTYYEVKTSLVDVTGKEVESESVIVYVENLTPTLDFYVTSPASGNYSVGTEITMEVNFDKPITIASLPRLKIQFGDGKNIELTGVFDNANNKIVYTYTTKNEDLGKLTAVSYVGSIRTYDGTIIDYNFVPEFQGNEIYARTGAMRISIDRDTIYYPYVQDAIDAANNDVEERIIMLLDEEVTSPILVPQNKIIYLDLNGKDIISRDGEYTAIINRGILTTIEEIGTGEISVYGVDNAKAIVNYGMYTFLQGIIYAKLENVQGEAYGIYNYGNVIMGENNDIISIQMPGIDSDQYGILTTGTGTFEFYDGVLIGAIGKSYDGELKTCDGYNIVTENIDNSREKTYIGIDKMPPRLDYEILTPGWRNDYVDVRITAYDADSGVKLVRLNNDELVMNENSIEVRFEENSVNVAYAEDNVGNSTSKVITINTIDKEAPIIQSITMEEEVSESKVEVSVSARDFASGLAGIIMKNVDEIPTDDEAWILFDKYPTSRQIVPMVINRGETNYCFAKDRAGNISRYSGEIIVEEMDKEPPVIQSAEVVKDDGKDYIIGKGVLLDVIATDNIGVTEILISDTNMTESEAKFSNDWKEYSRYTIHELPVDDDGIYKVYIWVKDAAGNISLNATVSVELKALIIGDNEYDYVGSDTIYNRTKLRFRAKDWNYDYDRELDPEDVILRLSSGDNVIRNITTGLTLKKLSDYVSIESDNYQYKGELYELEIENVPGTGNLSVVVLGGALTDLARNTIQGIAKMTDIFIDNNSPKITVENTNETNDENIPIRNITVKDAENNLIQAIEIEYQGVKKTRVLENGKITLALLDGEKITAYDKAGNEATYKVGSAVSPTIGISAVNAELVYGGEALTLSYTYEGDGIVYIMSSDTSIANASIDTVNKTITLLPVNAGYCEVVLSATETKNYLEAEDSITVIVRPRPVVLEWTRRNTDNNDETVYKAGRIHTVVPMVSNAILNDAVLIKDITGNIYERPGTYTARVLSLENSNYTVEGGTNTEYGWTIDKRSRNLVLDKESIYIRMDDGEVVGNIGFTYEAGEPDTVEATITGERIVSIEVNNAHGSGNIALRPVTVGQETLVVTMPETTDYAEATATCEVEITKLMTVIFDSAGGTPEYQQKTVEYNRAYGELPVPTLSGRTFLGWYTEREGEGKLITDETIVTATDKHTLYANWNRAPENVTVSCVGKTTNSITLRMSATDKDGDDLTFDIYVGGKFVQTTSAVAQGTQHDVTITGLTKYTNYSFYVVAFDGEQSTQSNVGSVRTYCPGNDYDICTPPSCDGYTHKIDDCGTCGGDGVDYYWCDGESTTTCGSCNGDGEITRTCDGGSSETCSGCGGTGKCYGKPEKVKQTVAGSCSTCGEDRMYAVWECPVCGTTGESTGCINTCNEVATSNHWNADGSPKPDCPDCDGTGKTSSSCSHNVTGSHEYETDCGNCGGDGELATSCSHGYSSEHKVDETCSNCSGTGDVDNATRPCIHNLNTSHYWCDHISSGKASSSSSSHAYCTHGEVSQHD